MQIENQKLDNQKTEIIKLTIETNDYLPEIEKKIKQYAKTAEVKGFRKGMVPQGMVKKMYGDAILAEEINRIIDKEIQNYFTSNEIEILGQPIPTENNEKINLSIASNLNYTFEFEYSRQPQVELNFDGKTFEKYEIKDIEKIVEKELENVKTYFKTSEDTENPIEDDKDVIYFSLNNNKDISVESSMIFEDLTDDGKNAIKGKKKGDKLSSKVNTWFTEKSNPNKYIFKFDENTTQEIIDQTNDLFDIEITNVKKLVIPNELSPEQIGQVTRDEQKNTVEDLKEFLKNDIEKQYESVSNNFLFDDIYKFITREFPIELPEDFLKRWITNRNDYKIDAEKFESEKDMYFRQFKWEITTLQFAKKHDIKVNFDEVRESFVSSYKNMLMQYGMPAEDQFLDNMLKETLKDRKKVEEAYQKLLDDKIFAKMAEMVKTKAVKKTEEEFTESSLKRKEA